MERSKLPNKKEFDKIVEAAFTSNEHHNFSEQYRQKKDNMQRGIIMKKINNKSERIFVGAVAAAIMAVVAVPTGVVIKNKINPEIVPGTDDATVIVEATNPEDSSALLANIGDTENQEIVEESPKTYKFGWLPEGMSFDFPNYEFKAHRESDGAGITPMLYKYAPGQELLPMNINGCDNVDRYYLDDRHVDIFYMPGFRHTEPTVFNRNVWITFEGSQYAVFLYVNDCVCDDELAQIIENISLVPAEEDNANIYTEPTYEVPSTEAATVPDEDMIVSPDELNLISVGDTITHKRNAYEDHTTVMDITVNDAFYTNNFNDLTTDNIGYDFDYSTVADILNDDGTLADMCTEWYDYDSAGDKFTKDYEKVGVKVLILDLTFTNKSEAKDDYCIASRMVKFINGVPYCLDDADRITSPQYYTNYKEICSERGTAFSFMTDSDQSKNHIILDSGESANVRLAFLIKETEVGNLYLNIATENNGEINEFQEGYPILDLCHIPEKE